MNERIRVLRGIEQALWITDQFGPFNVVGVLRLKHAPSLDVLRAALDQLQKRHRLLRTRIGVVNGQPIFEPSNLPIPIHVVDCAVPDDWLKVAAAELNTRIDSAAGPLLRLSVLQHDDVAHTNWVLTFHHTIVDASSGMRLFDELLRQCVDPQTAETRDDPLPAAAVDSFPERYQGLRFTAAAAPFMLRQMGDEMRFRWQARGEHAAAIAPSARVCILPIQLDTSLTNLIVRASRKHRITINSLLTAALMLAAKHKLFGSGDASIRHVTFADLRRYLDPPLADDTLGCAIAMARFTTRVKSGMDVLTLARIVHDEILASNRRGEKFITHVFSVPLLRMLTSLKAFRMGHTALSYVGVAQLQPSYGSTVIEGLHAFVSNIPLGPEYAALARLFAGQLWIDITYLDADMSREQASEIAAEMRMILDAAVASVPLDR